MIATKKISIQPSAAQDSILLEIISTEVPGFIRENHNTTTKYISWK
jgi:hypothetical protein